MPYATIIAVAIAALVILAAVWYLNKQTREDFEEATDYVGDDAHVKGGTSIPIRSRASALSTPAKLLFGSVAGIVLIVGIFAFQTIRTGSPAEVMFADQLLAAGIVAVGAVIGVIAHNSANKGVGELLIEFETEDGDVKTDQVEVDLSAMETDTDGNRVVTEYHPQKIAGVFRRYKHVGEDETLDGTHRAPGKPVKHQIPEHATKIADGTWALRTENRQVTQTPDQPADYAYSSPVELSHERYVAMRESKRRLDTKLSSAMATIAVIEKENEKLARRLKSGQYQAEQEILDKLGEFSDILQQPAAENSDRVDDKRSTHLTVDKNGTPPENTAQTDGGTQ